MLTALRSVTPTERWTPWRRARSARRSVCGPGTSSAFSYSARKNGCAVAPRQLVGGREARRPAPPLWPADPARRAEVDVFVEWFNRVWKVPPNAMEAELRSPRPDHAKLAAWADEMRGW